MPDKITISNYFKSLQDNICVQIENTDGAGKFKEDVWDYASGQGGGRTRVLENGKILEKAGVNFSMVEGPVSDILKKHFNVSGDLTFTATGVSIVMHPSNPNVPIIHMNVRYFEMSNGSCWFGGGIDLTPHYIVDDQAKWFHNQLKSACDSINSTFYPAFKTWADDYFFINHRNETRGIGGIFYDYLRPDIEIPQTKTKHSKAELFEFTQAIGNSFAPIYTHLMAKNAEMAFTSENKKWQAIRRGRYVEFNLVLDRGTKFGLETNGRTESILMSMPPIAEWIYDYQVPVNSLEQQTLNKLKKGIDWAS